MRKITLLCALLVYTLIRAQSISTESNTEPEPFGIFTNSKWILRGGFNLMNFAGDDMEGSNNKLGYNISGAFQNPIGSNGVYWGMELGLGSHGSQNKIKQIQFSESIIAHNIQFSPVTFGWMSRPLDVVRFDIHVGVYTSVDYAGTLTMKFQDHKVSYSIGDWDQWKRLDMGMNFGMGIWFDRYNLDFTYQYGFIDASKMAEMKTSNFQIRLGVSF